MSDNSNTREFFVTAAEDGQRIDVFTASQIANVSRSRVKHLIGDGFVRVDGKIVKASHLVSRGERIVVELPPPVMPRAEPENIPIDVIYEDSDIIVVNKPAGMVVHPAAGHPSGTLVNALLSHCGDLSGIGGELKAGIVHRLDMGTSGVIIAAKNDCAHHSLSSQFKNRTVEKIYGALVFGRMRSTSGILNAPIGRSTGNRKRHSAHTKKGRVAHTEWSVLESFGGDLSWLQVRIGTGRTHQIRVHLSGAGHPLVGDPLYGGRKKTKCVSDENIREVVENFPRPALHSWFLGVRHPSAGEWMKFEAPLPDDLSGLLGNLRATVRRT